MRTPLLVLHIAGGMVGLLSGAVAMIYRKGSRGHRLAGDVFVVAMVVMGACAAPLAWMKHDVNNLFGGLLTIYLVATAWRTAQHREDGMRSSAIEWGGFLFALAVGSLTLFHGWQKATGRVGDDGTPTFMSFFLGSMVVLAAFGDLRVVVGGITGRARIVRHLWRMCFGWFFASGSFFLGPNNRPLRLLRTVGLRQALLEELLRQEVRLALAVLPLVLMVFWLIRVRWMSAYKMAKPISSLAVATDDL